MTSVLKAFEKHRAGLWRYASGFMSRPQDVEDILQTAFLRAFATEIRTDVKAPKNLLYRAVKHVALNELARLSYKTTDYIEDMNNSPVLEDTVSVELTVATRQKLFRLTEAVADLPPRCRQVFIMRKFEGLGNKEIAVRLGISISAVEKQLATGLVKCRNHMQKSGYKPAESGKTTPRRPGDSHENNLNRKRADDE